MPDSHDSLQAGQPANEARYAPSPRLLILAVFSLLLVRLVLAAQTELLPEEAYYWNYLQNPALGYFDHPPMVSWVIGFGTALLGDGELGVRMGTILLSAGSCLLVFLLSRLWFGEAVARWTVVGFLVLPVFLAVGFLAFPDGPLIFFWLLTLYAVSKALHAGPVQVLAGARRGGVAARAHWLLAGGAFGGALLSKYTAVLLAPSLLLFLTMSPAHRAWLRRPQPWLALGLGLLVFSPVIVWNAQNEWASFLFQSTRTAATAKRNAGLDLLMFWLFQLAVTTPVMFALFARTIARSIRSSWQQHEAPWIFAGASGLPLFLVFVYASFKTEVHINWTAPAIVSLLPAAAAIFTERLANPSPVTARRWRIAGGLSLGLCVLVFVLGHINLAWGWPKTLAYSKIGGWKALADEVEKIELEWEAQTGQHPFVIGADKYNLAAELNYYARDPGEHVNTMVLGDHGLGFHYWVDLTEFEGRDAVAVLPRPREELLTHLRRHFRQIEAPQQVQIPFHGRRPRTFHFVFCRGYRRTVSPPPTSAILSSLGTERR